MTHLASRLLLRPLIAALILPATAPSQGLRLHPANPHYFLFRGKPAVLITSGEHYGAVLNLDFDYRRYLRTLAADRLNLTRTFTGAYRESPASFNISENTLAPKPERFIAPWPRTGSTGATDGLGKFDLQRWDDAYFARLKDFVREAGSHDIVVELALFCPFYEEEMWNLSPMNARNNVNYVGDIPRGEVYTLKDSAVQHVQDSLVRKIVEELRGMDNVMFEIANEPYISGLITSQWERHMAGVIEAAEARHAARERHLITQNIANGSRKVPDPDPRVSVFNFHYCRPPDSVALNWDLKRPIGCNETGFDGQADATYRVQGWEFILSGGALYNNLDYSFTAGRENGTYSYPPRQPGGGSPALRRQLRVLRDFMDSIEFARMVPAREVLKGGVPGGATGWVLAEPGRTYAVYLHHGSIRKGQSPRYAVDAAPHEARLELDLAAGSYRAEWIDTKTGKAAKAERLSHKAGTCVLTSPRYTEDVALRIQAR